MAYPSHKLSSSPHFDDRVLYRRRLEQRESSLFSDTNPFLEVIIHQHFEHERSSTIESRQIRDSDSLGAFLESLEGADHQDIYFIIRQKGSWGRFQLSGDMFKCLLTWLDAFPHLVDYVLSFGFKLEPCDENFGGLRLRVQEHTESRTISSVELVYNLRYVEKHGRNLQDPWSLRQTAVYQQYDGRSKRSRFVIIQPSIAMYRQLKEILPQLSSDSPCSGEAMHSAFLWSSEANWREYTNYLEKDFRDLEEKALLSRVGQSCPVDFRVAFADVQKMQTICNKLYRCRAIIDTSLEVASGHKQLHGVSRNTFSVGETRLDSFEETLGMYEAVLRTHRRGFDTILDCSVGISKILFQILEYRNDETMIQTSHAQQLTSERTKLIAEAVQEESRSTVTVLTAAHSDSQVMKTLTFVAMFYLPASLVASIFNSNLIQVEDGGASGGFNGTGMRIVKGFWMFPVLTIALLLVTLVVSYVLVRRL